MTEILSIRGLDASYGRSQILFGVDLGVTEGSITALLGANGAGKTTTLRAICNTLAKSTGVIELSGTSILGKRTAQIVRRGIAHVPDGRGTFAGFTVAENLQLGSYARRDKAGIAADLERVFAYFPRLGERRSQQAGTMSGGEQQMLAISRALMLRPKLLLLDEPSFGLAPLVVAEIFAILTRINREEGTSILLVEQNARQALAISERAVLLEAGRVALQGSAADLARDEGVRRAYLGY